MKSNQGNRRRILTFSWIGLCLMVVVLFIGCGNSPTKERPRGAERTWTEIIPEEGTVTTYGIPLSLENTQQFIDWFNTIDLSDGKQMLRDVTLGTLMAPCCDDYPISECWCECNLARSVWGMSAYLIKQYHTSDQIQEASSQWLHFIRPDYYVASILYEQGDNPEQYGLTTESSCHTGRCDFPFHDRTSGNPGGCGGMEELVQ